MSDNISNGEQVGPKKTSVLLKAIGELEKSVSVLEDITEPVRVIRDGEASEKLPEKSSVLTRLNVVIDRIIRVNNELEV